MRRYVRRVPRTSAVGLLAVAVLAGACSSGGSKGSSDSSRSSGVTDTTITVGNIADVSGLVPGLFQGAIDGTKAYADYINSKGGVNGKKIQVMSVDTGTNCVGAKQAVQQLVGKVIAFVGSFTLYDSCAATIWKTSGDPVLMYPLTDQVKALANLYSPSPAPPGFYTGPAHYLSTQHPGALQHLAMLHGAQAAASYHQLRSMYESLGGTVVYEREYSPAETNYTADILAMKSKGVQWLDLTTADSGTIIRVAAAAAQQGWKPTVWTSAPAYDPHLSDAKSLQLMETDGLLMPQPFAMFQGEDATRVPEVATFDTWYAKEHPGSKPDLFAVYGWSSMALFVKALQGVSGTVTQGSLLAAVQGVHDFDADGLLPTSDVGAKKPPLCWLLVGVKGGKFVRVSPPSPADGSFICDNQPYFSLKQ